MAAFSAILFCLQAIIVQQALGQCLQSAPIIRPNIVNPGCQYSNPWPIPSYQPAQPIITGIPSAWPSIPAVTTLPIGNNCGDVEVVGNSLGVGGAVGVNGVMPVSGCVGFSGNLPATGVASVVGGCSCTSPIYY